MWRPFRRSGLRIVLPVAAVLLINSCGGDGGSTGPSDPVPTKLGLTTQPASTAQNTVALGQQPVVQLRDAGGAAVSKSGVTVTAAIASGGGALGGLTSAITNSSGQAIFTDLAITGTVGARTLQFTSSGLTAVTSGTITLTAGPPTQLAITTQPSASAQSTVALAQQPVVQLRDVSGNTSSQAGVAVTATIASGGGTLGGSATVNTNGSGQAVFTGLSISGTAGARTLQFAATGLTAAVSNAITLSAGPAVAVIITTQPSANAQNTVAFAQQPVVKLQDASGNDVTTAGVDITASIASGGGSLGGTTTVTTNGSGVATFTGLAITGTTGARTLQFSGTGLTAATSGTVTLAAGPATQVAITTQPADTARSGVTLARQPVVQLRDASGNAVAQNGVTVTASVSSGGAALGGTAAVATDANGTVTYSGLSLTGQGTQLLQFAAAGLSAATSNGTVLPTALTSGVAVTALSGGIGSTRWYAITVPASQDQLVVSTSGGSGNVDLYVRNGELPTLSTNDCAATAGTNADVCNIPTPAAGTWYILLHGTAAYSSVALTATYSVGSGCTMASLPDTDGDRLPDCAENGSHVFVDSLNTGTDVNDPDTDDDGLRDGDEVRGTTGGLDLPGMGVNPLRKDLLLEYDWFDDNLDPGTCSAHSHQPTATAVGKVTTMFANANVLNPDGTTGITVIHDYGQGGLFTGGNYVADADGVLTGGVTDTEYKDIKTANQAANRLGYFHYVVLPHRYATNSNSSGQAEFPGNDLIVSLYCYGSDQNVANTIAHELGHNLNLGHGGNVNTNWKPNYNSVMNYRYQFNGIDTDCNMAGNGPVNLNFSYGTRPSLDENNLDETQGVCGNPPGPGLDWNGDADAVDTGIAVDINYNASDTTTKDNLFQVLSDYNDWANLSFDPVRTASNGAPLVPIKEIVSCPDIPPLFRIVP